jgi:hypothetical protein
MRWLNLIVKDRTLRLNVMPINIYGEEKISIGSFGIKPRPEARSLIVPSILNDLIL